MSSDEGRPDGVPAGGEGPLRGLRVVDASTFVSGPMAGRALADLGAEVLKVEPPGGEAYRRFGRRRDGMGVVYAHTSHGKQLLELDLKTPEGRAALDEALATADVLLTNWRPGVAESLGLTAERLRRERPRLVWCRISGFGQTGPAARAPAFDTVIQARSGVMFTQGDDDPRTVRFYLADKVTALMAVQTVLAAVHRRGAGGPGSVVDVSMLDSLSWFDAFDVLGERTLLGDTGDSVNRQLQSLRATPTADGWVLVNPVRGRQLQGVADAAGHPEWIAELRSLAGAELTRRLFDLLASVTPSASTAHWLAVLADHDVPAAEVLDLDGHLADPQVAHNGTYQVVDHPVLGPVRLARHPARWDTSGSPGSA